jgi:predicted DNA binding CopG/RHH family protein
MARKKVKAGEDFLMEPFNFDNAVGVNGPITKKHLKQARAANKILKSVRYDADLLAKIQELAEVEGIPYQTLMNSLLKLGIEVRTKKPADKDLLERIERIERAVFKKHG